MRLVYKDSNMKVFFYYEDACFLYFWFYDWFLFSHQSGDTGTKRAKLDQESECNVNEESNFVERSTTDREKHMASSSLETVASTSYATSVARTEKPDVDLLPNEMLEMRIRDEKTADQDEKVIVWSYTLRVITTYMLKCPS